MKALIAAFNEWAMEIRAQYNVNPYIFIGLYLACAPVFWLSGFQSVRALVTRNMDAFVKWVIILGITILTPLAYVAIFGRNLPTWFWFALGGFLAFSILSTVRKMRKKLKQEASETDCKGK